MSAIGPKRTSLVAPHMSAFGGKADIRDQIFKSVTDLMDKHSPQLFGATQTADHRDPEQIVADQSGIGGGLTEPITEFVVRRFEIFLVLNRLPLHMFLGDKPTLQIEAVELGLGLRAAPDSDQAIGQVYRIVDATIHTHATERIVDMGGITDQEGAAAAECLGDALMNTIKRRVSDLIAIDPWHELSH